MKYILYSMLALAISCGGTAAVRQENRTHILRDTLSLAWRRQQLEARALEGARILRATYVLTPEQSIHFESAIASADQDICYVAMASDSRQKSELVFAIFEHDSDNVRYSLEPSDAWLCGGPGFHDLTSVVQK
jgi:hypothetical protein